MNHRPQLLCTRTKRRSCEHYRVSFAIIREPVDECHYLKARLKPIITSNDDDVLLTAWDNVFVARGYLRCGDIEQSVFATFAESRESPLK